MKIMKKVVDVTAGEVRIEFANERGTVKVALDELSADMVRRAALHGLSQKIGDAASGAQQNGGSDPIGWAMAQCVPVRNSIVSGEWNLGRGETGGVLAEALFRASERADAELTLEQCQNRVTAMDEDGKKNLRKALAVEIKEIELERAKARATDEEIDFDELFA